jgi:hypothetical protein
MLFFRKWLENSGPPGGLQPPRQEPTTLPGAWKDVHEPGSKELPPTAAAVDREDVRKCKRKLRKLKKQLKKVFD